MQWKLYFQTGAKEVLGLISSTGEPVNPAFAFYLKTFNIQELSVPELFQVALPLFHALANPGND